MQTREWWIGAAAPAGAERIELGEDHPTRAGAIRLASDVDGDVVRAAHVEVGHLHRGAEKLFEVRDLRQGLGLADRHDWQSPAVGEISLALAVEEGLGIPVPERATWLRTLAVEHGRLHTLLAMLPFAALDEDRAALRALRERCRTQLGDWTGSRLHPMLTRLGGVQFDVDDDWLDAEQALADEAARLLADLPDRLRLDDATGLAPVDAATADGWGLSGPVVRAAGLPRDLRVRRPSLAYASLPPLALVETAGDAAARLRQHAHEAAHAATLVAGCVDALRGTPGDIDVRLPKIVRLPEGEYFHPLEAPFGEAGLRVVSRGEKTPWRVFLRTPSQANVMALEGLLPGTPVAGIATVCASLGWVAGDVDK